MASKKVSAILIGSRDGQASSEEFIQNAINNLRAAGIEDSVVVCQSPGPRTIKGAIVMPYATTDFQAASVRHAIAQAQNDRLLLIDLSVSITREAAAALVYEAANERAELVTYFPVADTAEAIEIPNNMSADQIVPMISAAVNWPLAALATRKVWIAKAEGMVGNDAASLLAGLIVKAIADGERIGRANSSVGWAKNVSSPVGINLNATQRANILRVALELCNIEDLFPSFNWKEYGEESAALSYHTLAALFLRLGDSAAAADALALGDRLEDSPRSLALRGMIALRNGETLEAVAQMVSSLQQYELRKKENNRHYVGFTPRDLNVINSSLMKGLEALNKRDNSTAYQCFSEAVFNFDPFYNDYGLDRIATQRH